MGKRQTPTAVRVARWTAVAAGVTALGSTINTMWEKKPWFLGGEEEKAAVHVTAPASAAPRPTNMYVAEPELNMSRERDRARALSDETVASIASVPMPEENVVAMVAAPEPTALDRVYYFKDRHPIYFWLIVSCVVLIGGSVVVEYFHRKNEKKVAATDADNDSDHS